jgi:hypothetical protein
VQEVLDTVAQGKGRVTRVMLDNMVVPLPNGDVDLSMLQQAVTLIDGRFETEVSMQSNVFLFFLGPFPFPFHVYCFDTVVNCLESFCTGLRQCDARDSF